MEQEVTFQEALRIIWTDRTAFQGYSKQCAFKVETLRRAMRAAMFPL